MRLKVNKKILSYLLVFLVLVLEVTVFFKSSQSVSTQTISILIFIVISFFYLLSYKEVRVTKTLFKVIAISLLLIVIQGFLFGISLTGLIGYPVLIILCPYLLYRYVGNRIFIYLANIIFYTSVLSTSIWLLQNLFPMVDEYLQFLRTTGSSFIAQGGDNSTRVSFLFIYTITHWTVEFLGVEIYRNSGLYHEPGAFAYFLSLGIGIYAIVNRRILTKKNIILVVIMMTTFSTAGYISLFVLFSSYAFQHRQKRGTRVVYITILLLISLLAWVNVSFLQQKIMEQFQAQVYEYAETHEFQGGRFVRVMRAVNLLSTSPIIGRGIITASRQFEVTSPYYFTGAGFWRTLASYGIIITPLILFFYFKGINRLCLLYNYDKSFAYFFLIIILIGCTSQQFFDDKITILFLFAGVEKYFQFLKN